jgi:hypothetical protein
MKGVLLSSARSIPNCLNVGQRDVDTKESAIFDDKTSSEVNIGTALNRWQVDFRGQSKYHDQRLIFNC